ncbi:TLC domain-containing protein 2 isoform X2 [Bos taurus]|uniref:TLC domain-containing protein 2 isoform X2 n=1 Tax=Bos taurus TaxID=9913 RepID=UPI000383C948|nr:TLC domain-containing protein 2 isoform X2 [Bos taurus]
MRRGLEPGSPRDRSGRSPPARPWRPPGSSSLAPPLPPSGGCTGGCSCCPPRDLPPRTAGSGGTFVSPWCTACLRGPGPCSGCRCTLRWPPTRFMATLPGLCCWWLSLWVVSCLSTAVLSGHYVGFSVVSLLLELNSIFLHLRQLLLLSRQAPSLAFSVTSWAALATLVLFRLVPLGWMSLWLFQQCHQIPLALVILGGTGLAFVGVMSISLGVHILVSDVLRSRPCPPILGNKEARGTRTDCDGEAITRDDSTLSLKD